MNALLTSIHISGSPEPWTRLNGLLIQNRGSYLAAPVIHEHRQLQRDQVPGDLQIVRTYL